MLFRELSNEAKATGTYNDIEAITGFQIVMAMESEGTVLDSERVHNGVTAVKEDESKGSYIVARWYWRIQSVYVMTDSPGETIHQTYPTAVKGHYGGIVSRPV